MKKFTFPLTVLLIAAVFSASTPWLVFAADEDRSPVKLDLETARTISLSIYAENFAGRGSSTGNEMRVINEPSTDETGITHTRLQQTFEGVPVWGAESIVHLNPDGSVFAITDETLPDFTVNATPAISSEQATDTALLVYGNGTRPTIIESPIETVPPAPQPTATPCPTNTLSACTEIPVETPANVEKETRSVADEPNAPVLTTAPVTDLWAWRDGEQNRLVYRVQMERIDGTDQTARPVYFIDAHSGEKVWEYNNLHDQTYVGSGASLYSGNVGFLTYRWGAPFFLEDVSRRHGTFDAAFGRFADADNFWADPRQRAGVDAHWGAQQTINYYSQAFGRRGVDNNFGPASVAAVNGTPLLASFVHYGTNLNNAFWDGRRMLYGDGDGRLFSPFVSVDVVGHELTHGVTQFSAGLIYSGESGGLNEAVSDIFGAMVERYSKGQSANTWKVGEEIYTPGTPGDALRYMDNPHADGRSIDHYAEYYNGMDVHFSSGIANKEFYLLANGGGHHRGGSMTGIGADKAALIWYLALTRYMTSGTNFAAARAATINAVNAAYGANSAEAAAVANSWCLVGVGGCTVNSCGTLFPNQTMYKGQALSSCNGLARLIFQYDGNVVLYKYTGQALWHTHTYNRPDANRLIMQGDGNFVLYNVNNFPLWNSGTWRYPGSVLKVQDDRNMVIYAPGNVPVWHTGTAGY